jgi:hypothetical protein
MADMMTKDERISIRMDNRLHKAMTEAQRRYEEQVAPLPCSMNLFVELMILKGLQASGAEDLLRAAGVPGDHTND